MEEPFSTTCLYTASAIATVLDRLPELHRNDSARVVFQFPPDSRIPDIVRGYRKQTLMLNAFAFSRAIRDLKFSLHNC